MDVSARLLQIAGDLGRYVVMRRTGPHKYTWRYSPLTLFHTTAHHGGQLTIGAELRRRDGLTYALAWDVDDDPGWAHLKQSAAVLAGSGARPLLERSPAGRGGHLWLLFPDPIAPAAGLATATAIAPALAGIGECWPRPDQQAIRLPGGWYATEAHGIRAAGWCPLALMTSDGLSPRYRGPAALTDLLPQAATPSAWIADTSVAAGATTRYFTTNVTRTLPAPSSVILTPPHEEARRPLPAAAQDAYWLAATGDRRFRLYFWITPHQVAAWFNARHPARALLPPDASGYGRATWRGERTGSVTYRPDGGWVDHGAGGRRADGQRDGGDPLDLYCRLEGVTRRDALRRVTREMIAVARAEVKAGALAGAEPVAWVRAILAPAGWHYYDGLRGARARSGRPGVVAGPNGDNFPALNGSGPAGAVERLP